MSLINDALKRARQAQQQNPFSGQPEVPLQPADYAARPNWLLRTVVGLLVLASLAGAGWFFSRWWRSSAESPRVGTVAEDSTRESAAKSKVPAGPAQRKQTITVSTNIVVRTNPVALPQSEAAAQPASTHLAVSLPASNAAALMSPTNLVVPAPPPSPFADLKLQSIIFREDKPAALINGEMLFIGDEIRGARVLRIERQSVTVERKGDTNELRLPRL
ncbi:MAG: hypothetical protein DME19_21255 [Verrucomicrobia bacterium]|nr:MAG: hypothetical protein DME19_21255 [Verrucomicrobiota bacterium]